MRSGRRHSVHTGRGRRQGRSACDGLTNRYGGFSANWQVWQVGPENGHQVYAVFGAPGSHIVLKNAGEDTITGWIGNR